MNKLTLCTAVACTALAASAARAALVLDFRVAGTGAKSAVITSGDSLAVDVYAVINDANGGDDGVDQVPFDVLTPISSGAALGHITQVTLDANYAVLGSSTGTAVDLDADGDLDRQEISAFAGFGVTIPGREIRLAGFTFDTAGFAGTGSTEITGLIGELAMWQEDGEYLLPALGSTSVSPLQVNVVPEPASLGLAGVAAAGLLARRRRRPRLARAV